ncbi:hypothetical protein M8818_005889 [Zalaria obscura]|uniref:Uncharacterized protein n=1 Tax=Zalaria obscura TaxID=2024903 RepID=A0ACC3S7K6_9PEZI
MGITRLMGWRCEYESMMASGEDVDENLVARAPPSSGSRSSSKSQNMQRSIATRGNTVLSTRALQQYTVGGTFRPSRNNETSLYECKYRACPSGVLRW